MVISPPTTSEAAFTWAALHGLVQGELHAVRHGSTERSNGIPRVTVSIKVNTAGYDQFIVLELQTEDHDVTVLDTEAEWKH
jgi:hypothetical protein